MPIHSPWGVKFSRTSCILPFPRIRFSPLDLRKNTWICSLNVLGVSRTISAWAHCSTCNPIIAPSPISLRVPCVAQNPQLREWFDGTYVHACVSLRSLEDQSVYHVGCVRAAWYYFWLCVHVRVVRIMVVSRRHVSRGDDVWLHYKPLRVCGCVCVKSKPNEHESRTSTVSHRTSKYEAAKI